MKIFNKNLSDKQLAFLLMLITVLCFPTMDVFAKILTQKFPILQVVWARYLGQFLLIIIIFFQNLRLIIKTSFFSLQILRSFALFCGTVGFFSSLKYFGLGETTAIMMTAPLIITFLAILFLNETIGLKGVLCLLIGFCGSMMILKPQTNLFNYYTLLPFFAAFSYSIYQILTRFLGNTESSNTTLFYTAGFGAFVTCILVPFVWVTPSKMIDIAFMLIMPIFGGLGHYCLILALRKAEATTLAPLNYLSLVFAMIWGYFIFSEIPYPSTITGCLLIVFSGLYLWYRNKNTKT